MGKSKAKAEAQDLRKSFGSMRELDRKKLGQARGALYEVLFMLQANKSLRKTRKEAMKIINETLKVTQG